MWWGKYGAIQIFYFPLKTAGSQDFKTTPTLAAGDAKVSTDGGAIANADTLPAESPAASGQVKWTASAAEMTGKVCTLIMIDAAGAEWEDQMITVYTYGHADAFIAKDLSALLLVGLGADTIGDSEIDDAATEIKGGGSDDVLGDD